MLSSHKLIAFVAATDLARARRFYVGMLRMTLIVEDDYALELDCAGTMLRVTKVEGHRPTAHTVLGWETSDIEGDVERLSALGVAFKTYSNLEQTPQGIWSAPSGAKVAWFNDPDGNVLSLSEFVSETVEPWLDQ